MVDGAVGYARHDDRDHKDRERDRPKGQTAPQAQSRTTEGYAQDGQVDSRITKRRSVIMGRCVRISHRHTDRVEKHGIREGTSLRRIRPLHLRTRYEGVC